MPISLTRDGDKVQATFDYSNATKNKSKKGEGFYYTFAINGGDKMHVNRHGFMAIDAAWCGKEGTMKIERVGVDDYYCEVVSGGADYPLELKQWNTHTSSYDDVQGWTMGMDPENIGQAAPVAQQPPQQGSQGGDPPQQQGPPVRDVTPMSAGPSWDDLAGTMRHALSVASGIWDQEVVLGVTGDVAGAIERMAVSLYIDARKMGLVAPQQNTGPMQEAVQKVVAAVGDAHQQELNNPEPYAGNARVVQSRASEDGGGDDLPF